MAPRRYPAAPTVNRLARRPTPRQDRRVSTEQSPAAEPPLPAGLLACWGIPTEARLTATHGTNNQTFVVSLGPARWVLRISQNLTAEQVRAEHRLLARLRRAGLPFVVPEPVPALEGDYLAETASGPATMTKWLRGTHPDLSEEQPLERFGRAIGQLSVALGRIPRQDAPHDWLTSQHVHPDVPDVDELGRELTAAGISSELTWPLAGFKHGTWLTGVGAELPVQVVHGDIAPSNVLVDERTGAVTAILDFEIAGAELRVQDLVVGLKHSGALDEPDWQRRTAALARGYCGAQELTEAEAAAVPDLLLARATGTVIWRAGRWRRGQASLGDISVRLHELAAADRWLASHGNELRGLLREAAA
jgi:homoserine kinase type II